MAETILIRNPRVIEIVNEEVGHKTGRSATEAAENLIFDGADSRRRKREEQATSSPKSPHDSTATARTK